MQTIYQLLFVFKIPIMKKIRIAILVFLLCNLLLKGQSAKKPAHDKQFTGIVVTQYVKYFFPKLCYNKYFANGRYNAPRNCYLTISSRFLSLFNTIMVFFIRIPQIRLIIKNKSVFGLSYFGNNLQFVMPAMTLGYGVYANLPMSIYIENLFIAVQSLIVLSLFFVYTERNHQKESQMMKFMFGCSMVLSALFVFQFVPNILQEISIWLQLLVFLLGRGSQLITNFRNKSTGILSMLTVIITVAANSIRIFSIIMEAPGHLAYLLNYLIPFFINGYILFQFYLYKDNQPKFLKEKKQKDF